MPDIETLAEFGELSVGGAAFVNLALQILGELFIVFGKLKPIFTVHASVKMIKRMRSHFFLPNQKSLFDTVEG